MSTSQLAWFLAAASYTCCLAAAVLTPDLPYSMRDGFYLIVTLIGLLVGLAGLLVGLRHIGFGQKKQIFSTKENRKIGTDALIVG